MARTPARAMTTPVLQRLELSRVARVATRPVLPQETQDARTNTSDFPQHDAPGFRYLLQELYVNPTCFIVYLGLGSQVTE